MLMEVVGKKRQFRFIYFVIIWKGGIPLVLQHLILDDKKIRNLKNGPSDCHWFHTPEDYMCLILTAFLNLRTVFFYFIKSIGCIKRIAKEKTKFCRIHRGRPTPI